MSEVFKSEETLNNIAIVMLSAIGDAVHVLPVANALKRSVSRPSITWVIQPVPQQLVYNHPAIDDFILFRRGRGLSLIKELLNTSRQLRQRHFDLVIGLQVYFKAGLLMAATRSPMKLGFDRVRARDMNWLFTTHRIPAHEPQHVQDQYLEFLHYLGVKSAPVEWNIVITQEERQAQRKYFEQISRPVCAIVVGTSKPEKNWSAGGYARLIEIIERDFGYRVMLVGGPAPRERAVAEEVMKLCRVQPMCELGDDLRRLLYLIDGADLIISPDTGPLHIARALEVPVVSLFGYTNPKRTGPYRKYQDLVVDGYARYPGEDYPLSMDYRHDGMQRITLEMVLEKFELAIKRYMGKKKTIPDVTA
jgi:heptosyltransferase I